MGRGILIENASTACRCWRQCLDAWWPSSWSARSACSRGPRASTSRASIRAVLPPGAVSDFEQEWYGKHLFAMEEPVLGAPRADAARGVSELRVFVLPTFGHPAAARYTFDKTATERRAIKLCGAGGYAPGEIGIDNTTTLTPTESAALLASLDASGYWSMPVKDDVRAPMDRRSSSKRCAMANGACAFAGRPNTKPGRAGLLRLSRSIPMR